MSSILTNTGAMVALQTMRGINQNLAQTQNEISTGKSVSNARDNAAIWAVSKTMEADVKGFNAISDTLAVGRSTVGVARTASETVTDLLTQMQGKIVAAQEDNVDRAKIQNDVDALRQQINSVVGAAQFNGLNLLNNTSADPMRVLSSIDRASDGTVLPSHIEVGARNFTTDAAQFNEDGASLNANLTVGGLTGADEIAADAATEGNLTFGATVGAGNTGTYDVVITIGSGPGATTVTIGVDLEALDNAAAVGDAVRAAVNGSGDEDLAAIGFQVTGTGAEIGFSFGATFDSVTMDLSAIEGGTDLTAADANGWVGQVQTVSSPAATVEFDESAEVNANDSYRVQVGGTEFVHVASEGDTPESIANALATQINGSTGFEARVTEDNGTFTLEVINTTGTDAAFAADGAEDGIAAGGLYAMAGIDVSTRDGAQSALDAIDGLIQFAIGAAADFGSAQGRIDTQAEFVKNLTDALTTGIGALVDADMEAASARLQALQVQQQLAIQSLSIANQAPQNILALFR